MKRLLMIFFCVLITTGAGYRGQLPDIESEFDYKKATPEETKPPFSTDNTVFSPKLKQIPRDNPKYVEIIAKKDKTLQYTNDMNTIVQLVEKLKYCIENKQNIQHFNGIVSNLIDHISLLEQTYNGKPESNYISYKCLMNLSAQARSVAVLRTEGQVYIKYLPYGSSGSVYTPQNIQKNINDLLTTINSTLYAIKNID